MKNSVLKVWGVCLGVSFLFGCGLDRDLDQYRRDQVLEELNRLKDIEGQYSGLISREAMTSSEREENFPLGALGVELEADTQVRMNPDGVRNEEVPYFKLKVVLHRDTPYSFVFAQAAYESNSKTLKATLPIVRSDLTKVELQFTARVNNEGDLEGSIGMLGHNELKGNFTLRRNVPVEDWLSSIQGEMNRGPTINFNGSAKIPFLGARPLRLQFSPPQQEAADDVSQLFTPIRFLRGSLRLSSQLEIVFGRTTWDSETQKISAIAQIQRSGGNVDFTLECHHVPRSIFRNSTPEPGLQMKCEYQSSLRQEKVPAQFEVADSSEPENPDLLDLRIKKNYVIGVQIPEKPKPDMTLESELTSRENDLSVLLDYARKVRVVLAFSREVSVVFSSVVWKTDTRTLSGKNQFLAGGFPYELSLECEEYRENGNHQGWDCLYTSTLNATAHRFEFRENPSSSEE